MNWRVPPATEKLRLMIRSPSHGSIPASTSCRFNLFRSFPLKTASTVQRSAPVRMSDLSARSPSKSCNAPMMIDFPAPVSPVTAIKPGVICHSSSSTSARFLIRNKFSTAGIGEVKNPWFRVESSDLEDFKPSPGNFQCFRLVRRLVERLQDEWWNPKYESRAERRTGLKFGKEFVA